MREVRIRPRAQLDLDSIYSYITLVLGAPKAASSLVEKLYVAIERAAQLPESGTVFSAPELSQTYRRILVKNYWVYYTHDENTLTVWRIFHTSRDIEDSTFIEL